MTVSGRYRADYEALRHGAGALTGARDVLVITGPDATSFLQGQLSQDVAALAPGEVTSSLLLRPDGKLHCRLRVSRRESETFVCDLASGLGDGARARLERFKLRVAVDLQVHSLTMLAVRGAAAPPAPAAGFDGAGSGNGGTPVVVAGVSWGSVAGWDLVAGQVAPPDGVRLCDPAALEAVRMATAYMTPAILLSDGYIANGAEPWRIPQVEELPDLRIDFHQNAEGFMPYMRDERTLARPWAIPGTPGLEHRIGGLEKEDVTGNVNYEPENHDHMVRLRAEKVARIVNDIPDIEVDGPASGKLLVLGWGSTLGAITGAVNQARADGLTVSRAHLWHINPFPRNLVDVLDRFERVLVPEMNLGQLALLLRARYLKDIETYSKVEGKPFTRDEILHRIEDMAGGPN